MSECRLTLLMREDAQGRDERWCDEHQNWSSDTSLPCYKARAEAAEAANQGVRYWLDNAGFPADTRLLYAQGYNDAMDDARSALQGESDV